MFIQQRSALYCNRCLAKKICCNDMLPSSIFFWMDSLQNNSKNAVSMSGQICHRSDAHRMTLSHGKCNAVHSMCSEASGDQGAGGVHTSWMHPHRPPQHRLVVSVVLSFAVSAVLASCLRFVQGVSYTAYLNTAKIPKWSLGKTGIVVGPFL